jgi:hypothetical protein
LVWYIFLTYQKKGVLNGEGRIGSLGGREKTSLSWRRSGKEREKRLSSQR